ncbi:MAG: type II secretion system minor pseudopilin GspJ [Pseudomonadota bacterium]
MRRHRARAGGFTLIEILVSMAIFALLSAVAYGTLSQILTSAEVLSDRMNRIQSIQRTMRLISQDFLQLAPRPIRGELGDGFGAALRADFQSGYTIELTRGGWSNPMTLPRSTLQRAAYRVEPDGLLVRYHWTVLDRTLSNPIIATNLLEDVENIAFLFMQENGEWTEEWPPQGRSGPGGLRLRPRAVQVILTLFDEGELTRIIEVSP